MWIESLEIRGLKSVEKLNIFLSQGINLLVGPNNSGKSTLLKALYRLQDPNIFSEADLRQGSEKIYIQYRMREVVRDKRVKVSVNDLDLNFYNPLFINLTEKPGRPGTMMLGNPPVNIAIESFYQTEPDNFIYPYLSKRKVVVLDRKVDKAVALSVRPDLSNLVVKIDQLRDPGHPSHKEFSESCEEVLGFQISTFPAESGKQAGLITGLHTSVALDEMGEGTSHLLGLIARLCFADNHLFLIEEIENDIHPKALKALLRLIARKAVNNQFVISTHSNIVAKYLGAEEKSRIFSVAMRRVNLVPTSTFSLIDSNPQSRRYVLEELGYEISDMDLWTGYILFEESSAERIVREFLIKWFASSLVGKIRTIAAGGASKVAPKFEDLERLFLFTHLEPAYKGRVWVVADGDSAGQDAIDRLRNKFGNTWEPSHFRLWPVEDFERYYPKQFEEDVEDVLSEKDKGRLRDRKKELLDRVIAWSSEDEGKARQAFAESASDVIEFLRDVERSVAPT